MPLPFILGIAVGAGAVLAYNNNKKIKDKASEVFDKSKDLAKDVKSSVNATVECIKEKAEKKEEKPKATRGRRKKVEENNDDKK